MNKKSQYGGQWPQQPQQPRGMQQYYNQYYAPQPQPAPKGTHKHTALIIVAVLLVITLVSLVFVYVNMGKQEVKYQQEEITTPVYLGSDAELAQESAPEFKITNFKFASWVDDNLNYQEIPATFNRGDKFWIYYEVNNMHSGELEGKYRTSYDEYIAVTGPSGQTIQELTGFVGTTTENAEQGKDYSFPIAYVLPTKTDYPTGKYDITIVIDDLLNDESATITAAFILK